MFLLFLCFSAKQDPNSNIMIVRDKVLIKGKQRLLSIPYQRKDFIPVPGPRRDVTFEGTHRNLINPYVAYLLKEIPDNKKDTNENDNNNESSDEDKSASANLTWNTENTETEVIDVWNLNK